MESRATKIAKNLAFAMMFAAVVWGGSWVLTHSFLAVYYTWILVVGYQVLLFALVLAVIAGMIFFAVCAINSLVIMLNAIFSRSPKKRNEKEKAETEDA